MFHMRLSGILPVMGRRVVVALGVAGMLMVASAASAQTAAAAAQPPDPLKFDGTHPAMILLSIKADQEAGFTGAIAAMKAGLAAHADAGAQALGKSMQLLKLNVPPSEQVPGQGPVFVYIVHIDAPSANVSYNFLRILYYSGYFIPLTDKGEPGGTPEERKKVDDIYNPLVAAVVNITPWPLVKK
jgi:hypothetical protein